MITTESLAKAAVSGENLSPEAARVAEAFAASIAARQEFDRPYKHYLLSLIHI